MATYLHRLGGWAFEHRWKALGIWVAVLAVVIGCAAAFSGKTSDKFEVPGTESQQAQELLEQKFPEASGATARVVYAAPEGQTLTSAKNREAVSASLAEAVKAQDVMRVVDPYSAKTISKDGRIGYADVIYPVPEGEIDDAARDELEHTADVARDAGLQVEFSGGVVEEESETNAESIGLLLGFVVLAITLASLLAAGMPLVTAVLGVGIGVTGITAMSGVVDVSTATPTLATMLGLAVGIDYALFILSRYRQNLHDGQELREAAANAVATAGSAVVFAGSTVVIALVGLLVVNIPFLSVMGIAAAATVAVAVLIALTLLPALMGFAGERLHRVNGVLARVARHSAGTDDSDTAGKRWAAFVTRRPLPVLAVGIAALLAIAIPATDLRLGLPDGGSQPKGDTEREAYDLLTEGFGPGFNGTLTGVIDAPDLSQAERDEIGQQISEGLSTFPGVAAVSPPIHNQSGELTIVQITPTTGPASVQTEDLVNTLRDRADEVDASTGIHAYITGTTALNIDTSTQLSNALPRYVLVVVGLALILLAIVFRSVLVPIKAAVGFLLTIAAAMGITVWIFQQGHLAEALGISNTGPIISFLPILMIGILFGLAMDYEVFLVSRMREAYDKSGKARESIVTGFAQSARVVTAAAVIMFGVFAAFILSDDPVIKSIGLALACGVLFDAFVVRMTLVPAVMALLGDRAWWLPSWLDRLLPSIDIEGESLSQGAADTPSKPAGEKKRSREKEAVSA
jgi:putative drug exporter of the RND superfamily